MVDVEADDVPLDVEVDDKAIDDLAALRARRAFQLDIEAVGLRVNAASWLVLAEVPVEEAVVDGRAVLECNNPQDARQRTRGRGSPAASTQPQKRMRPSSWT
jgi:hypothetical protein